MPLKVADRLAGMRDQPLRIESIAGLREHHRILRLSGPLTLANAFSFQNTVRADSSQVTVIDMTDVPYIDSAGIGILMSAYVSRQRDGRSLALVGVKERVQATMTVTQVYQLFSVFPSVSEAESALAR